MNKKTLIIPLTLIISIPAVFAAGGFIPDVFSEGISELFGIFSDFVMQKFLIFLLLFSAIYFVLYFMKNAPFAKGDDGGKKAKGPAIAISIAIAAIGTVMMPQNIVTLIFNLYSGIFSLILLIGPMAVLLWLTYKKDDGGAEKGPFTHLIRFVLFGILFFFINSGIWNFSDLSFIATTLDMLTLILFIMMIVEFFRSFKIIGAGATQTHGPKDYQNKGELKKEKANYNMKKAEANKIKQEAKDINKNISQANKSLSKLTGNESWFNKGKSGIRNILFEPSDLENAQREVDGIIDALRHVQSFKPENDSQNSISENAQDKIKNSIGHLRNVTISESYEQDVNSTLSTLDDTLRNLLNILSNENTATEELIAIINRELEMHSQAGASRETLMRTQTEIAQYVREIRDITVKRAKKILEDERQLNRLRQELNQEFGNTKDLIESAQSKINSREYPGAINNLEDFKVSLNKQHSLGEDIKHYSNDLKSMLKQLRNYETDIPTRINRYIRNAEHLRRQINDAEQRGEAQPNEQPARANENFERLFEQYANNEQGRISYARFVEFAKTHFGVTTRTDVARHLGMRERDMEQACRRAINRRAEQN